MTRRRLSAALLAVCLTAMASEPVSVDSVVAAVRTSIAKKLKDAAIAELLDNMKLAQRLDDRVIEILESEGAGPQTLGALQRLRDASRLLPAPADAPPGMTPAPPPSSEEEHRIWQSAADQSRDYTRRLPDFVCTETVHRWADPTSHEDWRPSPTIVAELTFFDHKEKYKLLTVEGKKSDQALADLGGATSQGEFGSILAVVFQPNAPTEFRWDHWTILRKRPTAVYFFRVSAAYHPHKLRFKNTPTDVVETVVGLHGYVYVDTETGRVMRLSTIAEDIPADFPVRNSSTVLDYGYADIAGSRYLLPMRAEVRIDSRVLQSLNAVEFHNYRKFQAETSVTFGKE